MLGGSATAWHVREASWDMLREVLLGGMTMIGGPAGMQKKKTHITDSQKWLQLLFTELQKITRKCQSQFHRDSRAIF